MTDPIPLRAKHRPQAMENIERPTLPADGVATNYSELVALLKDQRQRQGWSQSELDDRAGWTECYASKLEIPHRIDGRSAVRASFDLWLAALGVGIKLIPIGKAKKGWKRQHIVG